MSDQIPVEIPDSAATPSKKSPWLFVPSLYFQQGLPVMVVQGTATVLYKKMGLPNDRLGVLTSIIALPWVVKMLWAPVVDLNGKKRDWVLVMQALITFTLAACALAMTTEHYLALTLSLFFIIATLSATHDIALDGYYMMALEKKQQAFFMGIRSTFFRLAMIFCNGGLVMIAGYFEEQQIPIPQTWRLALLIAAGLYGLLMLYAYSVMPRLSHDGPAHRAPGSTGTDDNASFMDALRTFFTQPKIVPILLFILLYRFGESMLTKMVAPFLLDPRDIGGMGLSTTQVGMIVGNVGILFLVIGGLLGGYLISKYGLRRCAWPMVITMTIPNFFYVLAANFQPALPWIYVLTAFEYFGYGLGMAPYMVFTMYCVQASKYATSHYAIVTGLMAFGAFLAGSASGYLQKGLGYFGFFIAVCIATVPGLVLLKFIPLDIGEADRRAES